jgi:hypothetical protein
MKGSRLFTIAILVFLALVFALEYHLPRQFSWEQTYSHRDEEPFGCAVFDSIMSTTLPNGYSLTKKTFYQLLHESNKGNKGYLLVTENEVNFSRYERQSILKMARRGDIIMIVSNYFDEGLKNTLHFHSDYNDNDFYLAGIKDYIKQHKKPVDMLRWVGDKQHYKSRCFRLYPQLINSFIVYDHSFPGTVLSSTDSIGKPLTSFTITKKREQPAALVRPWGKGCIILACTPLLFTNYSILDKEGSLYTHRLLTQMNGLPVVRMETYGVNLDSASVSPLRYLLSQPPLRWALYLMLLGILIFMFFTARRRQRVIPIVKAPENKSIEFAELIGTLYYEKKDYADLVRRKFALFAEMIRHELRINVEDTTNDAGLSRLLAQKTGLEEDYLADFFHEIRPIVSGKGRIQAVQMKKLINKMNNIQKHL